jgi:hypothetical protein
MWAGVININYERKGNIGERREVDQQQAAITGCYSLQ